MTLQEQITQNRQALEQLIAQAKTIAQLVAILDVTKDDYILTRDNKKVKIADVLNLVTVNNISDLEARLSGKADLNGNPLEKFKALTATESDDVVTLGQLAGDLPGYLAIGDEFYFDETINLRLNGYIHIQRETFISGSQIFNLTFTAVWILKIKVGSVELDREEEFIYNPVNNTVEILGVLENGDIIEFMYQVFVNEPSIPE